MTQSFTCPKCKESFSCGFSYSYQGKSDNWQYIAAVSILVPDEKFIHHGCGAFLEISPVIDGSFVVIWLEDKAITTK